MSRENVKKFYELAENDMELAQKLASLDSEMALEASDLANLKAIVKEKIIPLANEKGLEFTAEEMVNFANEKYIQLSEDDLLEVSGGVSPKAAGLALSSVLLLSLGSAAAINLMNSNQDNISNVVSDVAPSKMASGEKEEGDNEEEKLQKDLDEMFKKLPKDKSKDSNMEDIEKELDKLFKGGKFGGGSAFRPGNGRSAGKNMLNRTIGKKGTSDFDFDKFLKELDDEIARESATSQAAKPKAATSEASDFDFDKFMEDINRETEAAAQAAQKVSASSGVEQGVEAAKKTPAQISTAQAKPVDVKAKQPLAKEEIKEERRKDTSASGSEYTSSEDLQKAADDLAKERVEDVLAQIITENDKLGDDKLDIDGVISTLKDGLGQDEALKDKIKIDNDVVTISVKGALAGQQEEATVTKTIDLHESYNELVAAQERIALDKKEAEEVVQDIKETPVEKPLTQGSDVVFENQNQIQKIVNDLASAFKLTVENAFKFNDVKTQLSEGELQQFVSGITDEMKSNQDMKKVAIVGSNTVTFFAKGQLKDGTAVEASQTVNVLELAKELNAKLPKAGVEDAKKDETEKPQEELIVSDISKPDAGGVSLSKGEATKLVSEYSGFLPLDFTAGQQVVTLINFLKKLGNVENLKLVDKKDRELLAQNIKHINDQIQTDKSGKPYLPNFYNWSISADDLNLVGQAFEIVKDDFAQEENKDKLAKPQEALKENPVVKADAGATVTTSKKLQEQADMKVGLAKTELYKKFQEKIKANNGIELNESNLNKLISETLNSYKGQENVTVDEKNGTFTFTAKGVTKGLILTGADSRSATLNVREFFAKLNNEATEERRTSEREKFDHTKYITATEADVTGGLKLARKTAKKMIREEFNKIIVEKYNKDNPTQTVKGISEIPAGKMAAIVNSLRLDDVVASIVKANLNKVDDFKIKDAKKLNGQFSIKTAVANEELKIGAIGYKLTGVYGFRQPELIKYGDEIRIREEAEKLIKESVETYTVSYKTVIGGRASAEAEALFKFLADNNLIKDGKIVDNVIDAIKDSDKEQFKKDVKHIAGQISGGEGSYSLSGKWRTYNVSQEKLNAIKNLATQLGG